MSTHETLPAHPAVADPDRLTETFLLESVGGKPDHYHKKIGLVRKVNKWMVPLYEDLAEAMTGVTVEVWPTDTENEARDTASKLVAFAGGPAEAGKWGDPEFIFSIDYHHTIVHVSEPFSGITVPSGEEPHMRMKMIIDALGANLLDGEYRERIIAHQNRVHRSAASQVEV